MIKNIGIILAGGLGIRFNANMPKQYMKLNGKEIIAYSIDSFKESMFLDKFVCVVDENEYLEKNIQNKYGVECIKGGNTRNESLGNAIKYLVKHYPNCEKTFIHEAARPFIEAGLIDEYLDTLDDYDAIITTVQITDSIGKINGELVHRNDYHLIQAPEAFWIKDLKKYFSPESDITATVHHLPENIKVYCNYKFRFNLKITYPEDLFIAEQLIKLKYFDNNNKLEYLDKKLKDKKVLLFGSSGGVGSKLYKSFKELGTKLKCPSSTEIDFEKVTVNKIIDYCDGFIPDIIINAAAYSVTDNDGLVDMFDKVFRINLKSNIVLIEYAKTLDKCVNIVLFSSSSSTKGRKNISLYSAAKAGINSIVESLAKELEEHNIYVNAIIPEKINTPMIQKLHKNEVAQKELLDVKDVINAVKYYSIASIAGDLVHVRKGL